MVVADGMDAVRAARVAVVYSVSDMGGGVDAVAFTTDPSAGWGPWGAANGTMWLILDRGDGNYKVGMRVRDVFGNAALGYRDVVLDTVPPVMVSFVVADGRTLVTTGDIDARITATDSGSGLREMRFRFDDAQWMPWQPFNPVADLTVPTDGPVTIEVMVVDAAGNAAGASATLTIDATPPTITTFAVEGGARFLRDGTVDLLINASDNVATSIEWAIVCGSTPLPGFDPSRTLASGNLTGMAWTFPGAGRYVLTLRVRDEVGFTAESSIDVVVDGTPPTTSLEVAEGRALTNATVVSVKWLAVDAVSGLEGARLRVDGGQWRALGDMWEPVSVDLGSREGPRTLELMAEDLAGNVGRAIAIIVVDTRGPTAEMHPTGELPDGTVAVDTRFWVEFSEPMERSSVRVVLLNSSRMNMDCTIEWLNGTSELEVRPLRALSYGEAYTLEVVGQDPAGNALGLKRATVLTLAAPPPHGLVVQGGGRPLTMLIVLLVAASAVVALTALRRRGGAGASGQPACPGRPVPRRGQWGKFNSVQCVPRGA
jgi:hypothetical protein